MQSSVSHEHPLSWFFSLSLGFLYRSVRALTLDADHEVLQRLLVQTKGLLIVLRVVLLDRGRHDLDRLRDELVLHRPTFFPKWKLDVQRGLWIVSFCLLQYFARTPASE